ncbi:hypothetical protein T2_00032 [Ralstonia phage Elie]|uniref:Terminase large subunit n=4 Tax=Bakolyvirus TaxID=2843355 RepID=A0A7G5BBR1_9CAUD|nr:terminase large subunit [Ralstonia phage Adzire]YP_010052775.1 terminase large subunit [Ralstonia phage Bakoly]YP_010077719.1 terminase large subunit [Ralstonia phage Simangalove]QMV32977.1 hypothetical protein T2_00032 [Ralstonia phage Elie]QMV33544.1 terminase large subunit [Ralstonia phage Jenny]QMV33689.1 terminase large subunit [Ralstonia phage Sarlave]QMV32349.1 terminase large subunit [Ralstonia phage Adzire]QMV32599.1 terminase large subunit [Ralstonia phage Bakoly]
MSGYSDTEYTALIASMVEAARTNYAAFVSLVHRPNYKHSIFSYKVCKAIDQFVDDVLAGKRPVLLLEAPPQHGKSSLVSRCLPPYLYGRLTGRLPAVRVASASYAQTLANSFARDVKSTMLEPIYREIFPQVSMIGFRGAVDRSDEFSIPLGGAYKAVGAGGPLTGFPVDVGIIDDPTKNAEEALSAVVQDSREAWLDSVVLTRLQLRSGLIIMGTPWSARDLMARARAKFENEAGRYTFLAFPALNEPEQIGYNPELPAGPLVPHLHDRTKLLELKRNMSEFWWSALYQQQPMSEVGSIFSKEHVQYYRRAELPESFARVIMSVDATFKDGNGTDYVFAGVWGKVIEEGAERVYLLDWRRERLSFTKTSEAIIALRNKWPRCSKIYIEEAANGAALIDMLSKHFPQIVGVPPLGSKEARAHATSWVWDNKQVFLPHPEESPGIVPVVAEITSFPDTVTSHDDSVDGMTIALHQLMLKNPIAAMITRDVLKQAQARR